jgi:DNA-binding NarL/FixJ family response regulator
MCAKAGRLFGRSVVMYRADPAQSRDPGTASDTITVLVKGEDGLLCRRITATLSAAGFGLHSGPSGNGDDDFHVVVLIRDLSAVARLVDLRADVQESGGVPTVIVSPEAHGPALRRALSAGACGLVLDTELDAALPAAVRAVAANQTCIPRALRIAVDKPTLSHREREVLKLAVSGRTNGEIAAALCLAESTVKSHLSAAFHRLGVRSRREAATLVLDPEEGLMSIVLGTDTAQPGLIASSAPQTAGA